MSGKDATMTATPADAAALVAGARRILLLHEALGVPPYPLTPELRQFLRPAPGAAEKPSPEPPARPASAPAADTAVSRASSQAPAASLDHVRETALACDACRLGRENQARVIGEGRPDARLFIVGEAPGAEDLQQARAFSGEVRDLLGKMLAAIGIPLEEVYLTNILKCRPDEGEAQAMARHCLILLREQIRAVGPRMILAMGPLPAAVLLHSAKPLLQLRGKIHDFHGMPLIATYHPGFLLRNQEMKKAAWLDLQLLQRHLKKLPA